MRGLSVLAALIAAVTSHTSDEWPDEWFEAMPPASEHGVTKFAQSPILDNFDLPPVEQRLPKDPPVAMPIDGIGKYGGTARIVQRDSWQFFAWEAALTISADMRTFLPNLAESFEVSDGGRRITITLREGTRWSDGVPLTSDDFMFTFNDLWLNEEFAPITDRVIAGGRMERHSDLSFSYVFEKPNPLFVNLIAQFGDFMVDPIHHYAQFHPSYTPSEDVRKKMDAVGAVTWHGFIDSMRRERLVQSVGAPTLRAYMLTSFSPTRRRYERNPFYFKVDPAGNQLPYIDAIESDVVENVEVITAKASTGELDFSAFELRTQDIPLLKLGERTGDIEVLIWKRLHSSDVVIQPNYNYADQRYRDLYWDTRFRIALSHAINREEMNDIIYFGRGTPRQVTVHPTSSFFEPHYATVYTEYDPDKSNALLDEVGIVDNDNDGYREFQDGSSLSITLEFFDFETPKGITMELVREYWREIGIDLRLKNITGALQDARAREGSMQMTLWHADRVTDILFPLFPDWWVPRSVSWERSMWNDWSRWYMSGGEVGEEPPSIIKQLQSWTDEMRVTVDHSERVEIGKKILQSNAENLWVIGTVGLAPHPVVVSKRLKGVPKEGIWGWDNRWTLSYHTETWYLDETPTEVDAQDDALSSDRLQSAKEDTSASVQP